jgi:hypothetical protein
MTKTKLLTGCLIAAVAAATVAADAATTTGWQALPNTRLRSVCAAENGFPQISGVEGCPGITEDWNGGVFDTKRNRLIIWGGGHNGYYGNEIYAVNVDSQTIERITDPGVPIAPYSTCLEGIVNNTQPNSRHTYDGIEYMANVDKMFVFGGSLACGAGNFGADTWTFDFATKRWQRMNPSGPTPWGDAGIMTAYDPNTGKVFLHDRKNLFSYDISTNKYTQLSTSSVTLGYHLAATIDPKRKRFVIVGWDSVQSAGAVYSYDISSSSTYQIKTLSTSGGGGLVDVIYPGLEYDPVLDRIVGWGEKAPNTIYRLNLDTSQWTTTTFSGAPTPSGRGTHGRWRYSPKTGAYVVANKVDDDVVLLRLAPAAPGPNPPTNVKAE